MRAVGHGAFGESFDQISLSSRRAATGCLALHSALDYKTLL